MTNPQRLPPATLEGSGVAVPRDVPCEVHAPIREDGVFKLDARAITDRKGHFERAVVRLPEAHREAQAVAAAHLHQHASAALEEAGIDSSPLKVGWQGNQVHLGIEYSPAGDALFDHEFGTEEEGPNPTIRTAVTAAHPAANALYSFHVRSRLGI